MSDFDKKAKTWDDDPQKRERAEIAANKIKAQINLDKNMRAMEYGCGTGLLSFALYKDLGHITLVDNSKGMLKVLEEKIKKANVHNMKAVLHDFESDKPISGTFDIIYSMLVIHHIKNINNIFSMFFNQLKKNGYLCLIDLDIEDGSFHSDGFTGHKGFEREEFAHNLEKAGFKDIKLENCCTITQKIEKGINKFTLFLSTSRKP